MNQTARGGHRAITREAVRLLFTEPEFTDHVHRSALVGAGELSLFAALDAAQRSKDARLRYAGRTARSGRRLGVPVGIGYTLHSAWSNGAVQREHGMADPRLSGSENVRRNADYVIEMCVAARAESRVGGFLGSGIHALQDSYSGGHVWRSSAIELGDPTAAIEAFQVFDPKPRPRGERIAAVRRVQGTHDAAFDVVPVRGLPELARPFATPVPLVHASDRAAARATALVLAATMRSSALTAPAARECIRLAVEPLFSTVDGSPAVHVHADQAWLSERDRRLALRAAEHASS